ncbi:hypothetical protein CRUP_032423, partial [Coryphaenoides rupestris]
IRNVETNQCVDNMGRKENEKVGFFNCHGMGGNQVFTYTADKEIRTDDLCLDVSRLNGPVANRGRSVLLYGDGEEVGSRPTRQQLANMAAAAWWVTERLTLLHVNSNQCLDIPTEEDKMVPTLRDWWWAEVEEEDGGRGGGGGRKRRMEEGRRKRWREEEEGEEEGEEEEDGEEGGGEKNQFDYSVLLICFFNHLYDKSRRLGRKSC